MCYLKDTVTLMMTAQSTSWNGVETHVHVGREVEKKSESQLAGLQLDAQRSWRQQRVAERENVLDFQGSATD